MDADRIRPELDRLFPNRADRQAVELMLDEERSTAAFAKVWSLGHLSLQEQRKEVKRGKDRLNKVLSRLGKALRERKG